METVVNDPPPRPVEALPYEPLRPPLPRRRVGVVMGVGLLLLLLSIIPCGTMIVATEQVRYENRGFVVGVLGTITLATDAAGLGLIIFAAREMLRR